MTTKRHKGLSGGKRDILYLDLVVLAWVYTFVKTHWNLKIDL